MLTKKEYIKLFVFFSIIFIIIVIQYFFSDSLLKMSVPLICQLQSDDYVVHAMTIISELGSKKMKSLLLIIIFSVCNTYHSYLYTTVCYSSILITSWLKIILQQPRPFWVDDKVKAFDCESGYGYPSNHVMSTVPSLFMFFEILYYHFKIDTTINANIFYWTGFFINFLICVSIGVSRMVLGVHSLDQVFFGLLMGFASYYFYLHIIDYDIRYFQPFLQEISNPFYKARMIILLVGIYIAFLINLIFAKVNYDPIWTERILKDCGRLPPMTPFYKCLADSGEYIVVFGMLIGIFYDLHFNYKVKYNKNIVPIEYINENISDTVFTRNYLENRTGKWNDTSGLVTIMRIIFLYLLIQIIYLIRNLPSILFEKHDLLNFFIFQKLLSCGIAGFFLFGFARSVCYHCNLTNLMKVEKLK